MRDIETMITELIDREGREYTDHAEDRGGPTKFGITQATLARWRGRAVAPEDVRDMEEPEARAIYRHEYLIEPKLHLIQDPYVLVLAFDCSVHHGPHRAVQWVQKAAGVLDDGIFGSRTEVAVNTMDPVRLYNRLLARRVRFFGEVIAHDPERKRATKDGYKLQAKFASGWLNRAAEFIENQV